MHAARKHARRTQAAWAKILGEKLFRTWDILRSGWSGDNNGQATHGARKHAWRMQAAWANLFTLICLWIYNKYISFGSEIFFGYEKNKGPKKMWVKKKSGSEINFGFKKYFPVFLWVSSSLSRCFPSLSTTLLLWPTILLIKVLKSDWLSTLDLTIKVWNFA